MGWDVHAYVNATALPGPCLKLSDYLTTTLSGKLKLENRKR